jgi:hypothetical protein
MEQDITGMSDVTNIPGNLPNDLEEPGSAERAADLVRERATGPVPLGPATPDQAEDAVLMVETGMLPNEENLPSPENIILSGMDLEIGVPWYRSRWMYLGTGIVAATALSIGATLLIRGRNKRTLRLAVPRSMPGPRGQSRGFSFLVPVTRAQGILSQWPRQLSGQTSKLTGQAIRFTGQTQGQISRLTHRPQRITAPLKLLRYWVRRGNLLQGAQQQLINLPRQAGRLSSLGNTARAATVGFIGKTQENLAQLRQGIATGAVKTAEATKHGWKLSRNLVIGAAAGALWAALFAPQSGEATRQRLGQTFQFRRLKNR